MPERKMPDNYPQGKTGSSPEKTEIKLICIKCNKEIREYDLDCTIEDGMIRIAHLFCGCPIGVINLKGDNHE